MSGKKKPRQPKNSDDAPQEEGEPGSWECTLCTYRNRFEAFKCEMCDTRKGTSTRKPRLNENVVQMQKVVQNFVVQQQEKAVSSYRKRVQHAGSPGASTSRQSPESTSSGSAARSLNTHGGSVKNRRKLLLIPEHLIYRTSPKKMTVTANGSAATITEFRRKPIASERVGGPKRNLATTTKPTTPVV